MNKFELTNWDELETEAPTKKSMLGDAMTSNNIKKLARGSNVMRIITQPYQYWAHNIDGKVEKCTKNCNDEIPLCQHCAKNEEKPIGERKNPERRWMVGAIDRNDNIAKILDFDWKIYQSLQRLNRMENWGNPDKYDIDIITDPSGVINNAFFSVIPIPLILSQKDVEISKAFTDNYLSRMEKKCEPQNTANYGFNWNTLDSFALESSHYASSLAYVSSCDKCIKHDETISKLNETIDVLRKQIVKNAKDTLKMTKITKYPEIGIAKAEGVWDNLRDCEGIPYGKLTTTIAGRPAGYKPSLTEQINAACDYDSVQVNKAHENLHTKLHEDAKKNRIQHDKQHKCPEIYCPQWLSSDLILPKDRKAGAICNQCKKDYPYAEPNIDFKCWECKNIF